MKKVVVGLGILILAVGLVASGYVVHAMATRTKFGAADQTSADNINVMLTRADDWVRLVNSPVITKDEMVILDGSTATIPITAELFRQFFNYSDGQVRSEPVVHHSMTDRAYRLLIEGDSSREWNYDTSLIFVTPPSADELAYAQQSGVELDLAPIARDGFVFITHKNNPIDSLTVAQIQGIYTGEITNWSQVGGDDRTILAYQREQNSGSQTAMEEMVMQGLEMQSPITTKVHIGMGALVNAVAEYDNGPASIGYTYFYYINNLYKSDDIKVIRVEDTPPTDDNLISGAYPFATNYLAVMRADEPLDSPARILRDYLLTSEGQSVIAMAGYCRVEN